MNKDEREKRLKQIREAQPLRRLAADKEGDDYCIGVAVLDEIDFLLSLLTTRQAARSSMKFNYRGR